MGREDTLAEWLRRRPAKPVGSARVGSNPTGVGYLVSFYITSRSTFLAYHALRARPPASRLYSIFTEPNIAQLVERSTVEIAGIEWSLVRFRVFGLFFTMLSLLRTCSAKNSCRDPGSNRGPPDLQSDALPTELSRRYKSCIHMNFALIFLAPLANLC